MNENQVVQRKPKLTRNQIDSCLMHMLRDPELFEYSKQHLRPTDFSSVAEMRYALVWSAALTAASRNNNILPTNGTELIIAMELTAKVDSSRGEIAESTEVSAIDFLGWIYGFDKDQLNPEYYRTLIQDLIIERTIVGTMSKDIALSQNVGRPVDIVRSLENYNRKLQSVLADYQQSGATAFPLAYKPKKIGKFSTGQPWLDGFMNGGQAPGEIYALLGPSGVGKTSTGIMLTISTARVLNSAFLVNAIPKQRVAAYFTWEQSLDQLRPRFWSNAATIDSTRLEKYADEMIELSTTGQLEAYELEDLADEIKNGGGPSAFPGELQRLEAANRELSDLIEIFDFSGTSDNPRLGEGGIDEAALALRSIVKKGKEIGVVVLDYAGVAVRRMLAARGEDFANTRHHLLNFCNEARSKIAVPFQCPVWILHQLNTESNKKNPTASQHHSYAAECGNFAENAWFAFVFGTKDKTNNACQVFCTKERRARGDKPPITLKIEGNYCRMVDASQTLGVDIVNKTITPKNMLKHRYSPKEAAEHKKEVDNSRPGVSDISKY